MNKIATTILVLCSFCCCGQQFKFVSQADTVIMWNSEKVAIKEYGSKDWVIPNPQQAIRVLLKIQSDNLNEIGRLREENSKLKEVVRQLSPKSFSVDTNPNKRL